MVLGQEEMQEEIPRCHGEKELDRKTHHSCAAVLLASG